MLPGWVKRGAMDPTLLIPAVFVTHVSDISPRLSSVLCSGCSHCRHLKCPVIVSTTAPLLRTLFRSAHGSLETSWLSQQSPGNFQLFLGSPFHRGPLQKPPPQLETSLVHIHVTSKTLVTPVNWQRDPTSSDLQDLWGRAEDHAGFLCDPVTHQFLLGFPPVMDALQSS